MSAVSPGVSKTLPFWASHTPLSREPCCTNPVLFIGSATIVDHGPCCTTPGSVAVDFRRNRSAVERTFNHASTAVVNRCADFLSLAAGHPSTGTRFTRTNRLVPRIFEAASSNANAQVFLYVVTRPKVL